MVHGLSKLTYFRGYSFGILLHAGDNLNEIVLMMDRIAGYASEWKSDMNATLRYVLRTASQEARRFDPILGDTGH